MADKKYLGIDLGTSNSALSCFEGDKLITEDVEQLRSASSSIKKNLWIPVFILRRMVSLKTEI